MTIEEQLRAMILRDNKNMSDFCQKHGLTYTTVDTILKRGIRKAGVNNMILLCQALGISLDALVEGRIEKAAKQGGTYSVEGIIENAKKNVMEADGLTLNGRTVTDTQRLMIAESLDFLLAYQQNSERLKERIDTYVKKGVST